MPDPIDELSSFEPGVPMSPMSPAEIRRRGERLRRRNTALAVGGAAAAVLLVVVPVAVFRSDDGGGGTPQPAQAPITADHLLTADELPVRDRLSPWEETMPDGQVLACAPQAPASLDETVAFRRDFRADVADAPSGEVPVSVIRTEVLQFDDATEARQAYDQAQGWVLGCPGGDDLARKGISVSSFELDGGGLGEWRLHEFYAPDICEECDAIRFDRMGIAQFDDRMVLVSLAEVGGPLEPEGLDDSMNELFQAAVAKAGGEITGASGSDEGSPEPESLDFPIDTGLPVDDVDFTVEGPGPEIEGVPFPEGFCGAEHWPADGATGRLAVKATGPEYGMWRELVTFVSADEASLTVSALRDAVAECPTLPGSDPANDLTFEAHDVDSGYDDATFAYTYSQGLGGVVYQFVRVGHAVLATAHSGEYAPESTGPGARELSSQNEQLTALMCEYTEEGC